MTNQILRKLASWLGAIALALSFSVLTGACVFETDDDDDVEQIETDEEGGSEVETEVEVEDEETP